MKETTADVSSVSPSSEPFVIRSDEGLSARNVSYWLFHGVHYPHQHSVDTLVCQIKLGQRGRPAISDKSWTARQQRYIKYKLSEYWKAESVQINSRQLEPLNVSVMAVKSKSKGRQAEEKLL